jgi:hypothetical protein
VERLMKNRMAASSASARQRRVLNLAESRARGAQKTEATLELPVSAAPNDSSLSKTAAQMVTADGFRRNGESFVATNASDLAHVNVGIRRPEVTGSLR